MTISTCDFRSLLFWEMTKAVKGTEKGRVNAREQMPRMPPDVAQVQHRFPRVTTLPPDKKLVTLRKGEEEGGRKGGWNVNNRLDNESSRAYGSATASCATGRERRKPSRRSDLGRTPISPRLLPMILSRGAWSPVKSSYYSRVGFPDRGNDTRI